MYTHIWTKTLRYIFFQFYKAHIWCHTTVLLWWLLHFIVIWSFQPGLSLAISSHYSAVQLPRTWSHQHNDVWRQCHHSFTVMTSTEFQCNLVISTWLIASNIVTLLCSSAPKNLIASSPWSLSYVTIALLWFGHLNLAYHKQYHQITLLFKS